MAFESKNIRLDYKVQSNQNYYIKVDKDKLKQVFINLISNSLKFAKTNGKVSIDLSGYSKNIIVKIQDNGIGIKKEDLPFVFERLYRGDKSRHKVEGNGVGLTIVKNILDLHCVTVELESKEGEGTAFTMIFNK